MYREVTMIEVQEVLRLWRRGRCRRSGSPPSSGSIPKPSGGISRAAAAAGVRVDGDGQRRGGPPGAARAASDGGRPRGDGWARCGTQRAAIARWLADGLRLTKIRKLLAAAGRRDRLSRRCIASRSSSCSLARRRRRSRCSMASPARSSRSTPGGSAGSRCRPGKRRRFRAWIFTAVRSRHRFVYPTFEETTARAIEACEAAWEFFGGVFTVLIPDNTKAIIIAGRSARARASRPRFSSTRKRATFTSIPRASGSRATKGASSAPCRRVRDDCFAGEVLHDARGRARARAATGVSTTTACAGTVARSAARSSTFRPRSSRVLLAAPTTPYDIPLWSEPKVARDQLAAVDKALYSIPHPYVGQRHHAPAPTRRSSASTRAAC